MPRPKEVVVEQQQEEVRSDGLEITSIGSLYKGPWEKKYWSSSRGKDRYPYPVGYEAVRAENGSTCKMEIHEGPKGPLFMITSADGHSCSGQTPAIAWAKFQRKHFSHMKAWHGKRLSCKIDGMEFFGFKNSFVQRLLRELVANINGTAEKSLLSSSFCNGASSTEHDNQNPEACAYPDLQPHLERIPITNKRSRRCESAKTKPAGQNCFKTPRSANWINHEREGSVPPSCSEGMNDIHKIQGALTPSACLNSKRIEEKNSNLLVQDNFVSGSIEFSDHLVEGSVLAQEVNKFASPEISKSTRLAHILVEMDKLLDRSIMEDETGYAPGLKDSSCVDNVSFCARDTFNFVEDNTVHSSPTNIDKSNYNDEDFTRVKYVISEGLGTGSHAEGEVGASNSKASFEKGDFDSVGQDINKAMMAVLLPQAIPLLNKVSGKNKTMIRPSETSPCTVDLQEGKNEISHMMNASLPAAELIDKTNGKREENLQTQDVNFSLGILSVEHSKSVVLDSFEDDQYVDHITNQIMLSSDIMEADEPRIDKDTNLPNLQKELVLEDLLNESVVYHVETRNNKSVFCDEANTNLDEKLLDRDVCMSESLPDCRSSSREVFFENVRDVFANLDKNLAGVEIHPVQEDLKIESDCTEDVNEDDKIGMGCTLQLSRKDIAVKAATIETGSSVQVPNKVYSRKRVSKRAPLSKKFDGPLSESIKCRNFEDDYVSKRHHAAKTMLAPTISQMSCFDDTPHKEDFVGAKAMLDPKDNNFCNSVNPSTLHMKKSEANSYKDLVEQVNLVDFNTFVASQKQEISSSEYKSSSIKETKLSSDLKLQKNMERNNELAGTFDIVGCYFHPMAVLSVLLCTIGNEISVCVSCGSPIDKKRTLFIYKVAIPEPRVGYPSFVGCTSVMLPFLKDNFGREIALERSCLLFTPDGQYLVLLDSMRTPYCREGKIDCLCSTCTSGCFEENAVKIVHVKSGYVSVVAKLKTADRLQCILVSEPNHLIAVGESGQLHLWEMNSTWSAQMEECIIPINDCIYPCIVELKRIPKSASLVVGHNGFGEFGIWDISKRAFVSRFSTSGTSIYQFVPINLFSWQRNGSFSMNTNVELTSGIMAATKSGFSKHKENHSFLPLKEEDTAVWLLVSTISDSDAQHDHVLTDVHKNPIKLWRLALLVKNTVILGSPLDPRSAAIGVSSGHGIIGTHDGLVYAWELSSGNKLGTLHHFKGGAVSCIAVDDSRSQVLAVAGDGGQLLVYLHAQGNFANQ